VSKILYIGAFSLSHNTESYAARALERLGQSVIWLEETTANLATILETPIAQPPDVLMFAKCRFREADNGWPQDAEAICKMIAAVRPHVGKVICWLFDLLAADFAPERFKWASQVAAACDVFALTDGATAPLLPNSFVLPQGAPDDCDKDCPWDVPIVGDVLFLGCAYRDRQQFVQAFSAKFGSGFRHENNVHGPALTRLVRSYRVCVSPYYPSRPGYESNRRFVVTGHGGLLAAPLVGDSTIHDGWLPSENYLLISRDPDAAASDVQAVLGMDQPWLSSIRRAGALHAHAHCRYTDRVQVLLDHLASV